MHPYKLIPHYAHWRKAVAAVEPSDVDPAIGFKLRISSTDKIVTAGSCFAQHIARHLSETGFNYYVAEDIHPMATDEIRSRYSYGPFSARYGNIYTSRQLLQLIQRAYGEFAPVEKYWIGTNGRYYDPFRPTIQPNGFATEDELVADGKHHLSRVRIMFESMDVFVFTFGLTEAWISSLDEAVFPLCPGVVAGEFNPSRHKFLNLTLDQIVNDMRESIDRLRTINPQSRIILTVSPVPLAATAENRHVLVSTSLSKSILRVACDILEKAYPHVAYFPSYEIITGAFSRGNYYADDLRSITAEGVSHVMRSFLKNATVTGTAHTIRSREKTNEDFLAAAQRIVEAICDEELLLA